MGRCLVVVVVVVVSVSVSFSGLIGRWVCRPAGQSVGRSVVVADVVVGRPVGQLASRSAVFIVVAVVCRSASLPACRPVSQSVGQTVRRSVSSSVCRSPRVAVVFVFFVVFGVSVLFVASFDRFRGLLVVVVSLLSFAAVVVRSCVTNSLLRHDSSEGANCWADEMHVKQDDQT